MLGTFGPPAIVAREFETIDDVDAVLLFGSWAARYLGEAGRAPSDVDALGQETPPRGRAGQVPE